MKKEYMQRVSAFSIVTVSLHIATQTVDSVAK